MFVRKDVLKIKSYQAGKPIEEVKRELGLDEVIKLASNENPLGPSPKAVAAVRRDALKLNRYPDSASFYLKEKLARYLKVKPASIVLGNGSDELIDIIIKTLVEPDENIITADTTFLEYEIIAQINARRVIKVPLKGFRYDLDGIAKKINKKTKLIFIANPNNPTGTYVSKKKLDLFVKALPKNVFLVLDEAYEAFIDVNDFPYSLKYKNPNVIALKTFSKAYGLAGLRIGYIVCDPSLASYMERVRQPFNVNLLAQSAAAAALADKGFLEKTRRVVLRGKQYIYENLDRLGVSYVPSVANFVLIDVKRDCVDVFRQMLKYGVIVRDMKQYGLDNYIRVTIGTQRENKKFIEVLEKILGR